MLVAWKPPATPDGRMYTEFIGPSVQSRHTVVPPLEYFPACKPQLTHWPPLLMNPALHSLPPPCRHHLSP